MKTVGLIAEYNPFHNGHRYHIEKAKELSGADVCVVVMSGNFVQRGAPAIFDKYTRTRMALCAGADIVFELPLHSCLSSAEDFAKGGVDILNRLGFVDAICFGSECGDLSLLEPYADLFATEPPRYRSYLQAYLRQGMSFPKARHMAAADYFEEDSSDSPLSLPNNSLGIEYMKALKRLHSSIEPLTIPRMGAGYHDIDPSEEMMYHSATSLRRKMFAGEDCSHYIPAEAWAALHETNRSCPLKSNDFSSVIYYAICEHQAHLTDYKDISQDLANRILSCLSSYRDADTFSELITTKQYTQTRINRCLFQILFGLKKDSVRTSLPPRLLGMKAQASSLLAGCDIITRLAKTKEILPKEDFLAADIYNHILFEKYGVRLDNEYRHSPIVLS